MTGRSAALATRAGLAHALRKQRADDDLGARADRRLGRLRRRRRASNDRRGSSGSRRSPPIPPPPTGRRCAARRRPGSARRPASAAESRPTRTGPAPSVSPTGAVPFKGWTCTGVRRRGHRIVVDAKIRPAGRSAARQAPATAQATNDEAGRAGGAAPEIGQRGKSRHSDPPISAARENPRTAPPASRSDASCRARQSSPS